MEPTREPQRQGLKRVPSPDGSQALLRPGGAESWIDLLPSTLFHQSESGNFLWMSDSGSAGTGISSGRWCDEHALFWDCVHELDEEPVREHFRRAKESGSVEALDYRLRLPETNRVVWVSDRRRWTPSLPGGPGYQGSWTSATDRCEAAERLPWAVWQRTLSSFAPGVAHDLNNYFTSILTLSDNFVRKSQPDHPFHDGLRTIRDSVQQATKLVQRLVGQHVARAGEFRYHNLNELLTESLDFLRHTISRRITFTTELHPASLPIYADAVLLRQALFSLVKNAVEAIPLPQAGKIHFRTSVLDTIPGEAGLPQRCVRLSVSDSGPGVDPRLSELLFEPWSTTRPPSEGLGWGLFVAREILQQHRGGLMLDPSREGGTTFHLWLPQSDLTEGESGDWNGAPSVLVVGTGEALEDAAEQLRSHGFRVTATHQHALEIFGRVEMPFRVLCLLESAASEEATLLARQIRLRRWNTLVVCEKPLPAKPDSTPFKPDATLGMSLGSAEGVGKLRDLLHLPPFQ